MLLASMDDCSKGTGGEMIGGVASGLLGVLHQVGDFANADSDLDALITELEDFKLDSPGPQPEIDLSFLNDLSDSD